MAVCVNNIPFGMKGRVEGIKNTYHCDLWMKTYSRFPTFSCSDEIWLNTLIEDIYETPIRPSNEDLGLESSLFIPFLFFLF
jgi:hypothetical protein